MKKLLIFFTIITISFLAFLDAKKLISDEIAASRTPSQIEIRPLINKDRGESSDVKFDSNKNELHKQMRNNVDHNFQKSIDKMNNQQNLNRQNNINRNN